LTSTRLHCELVLLLLLLLVLRASLLSSPLSSSGEDAASLAEVAAWRFSSS
jgi:hypothetical protein